MKQFRGAVPERCVIHTALADTADYVCADMISIYFSHLVILLTTIFLE